MAGPKRVGIRELKNNLSAYLREVRRGERFLVSDRDKVVAELHEPEATYGRALPADPILQEWVRRGVVVPPSRDKGPLPQSPVRLEEGTAKRLLDEDRGES